MNYIFMPPASLWSRDLRVWSRSRRYFHCMLEVADFGEPLVRSLNPGIAGAAEAEAEADAAASQLSRPNQRARAVKSTSVRRAPRLLRQPKSRPSNQRAPLPASGARASDRGAGSSESDDADESDAAARPACAKRCRPGQRAPPRVEPQRAAAEVRSEAGAPPLRRRTLSALSAFPAGRRRLGDGGGASNEDVDDAAPAAAAPQRRRQRLGEMSEV